MSSEGLQTESLMVRDTQQKLMQWICPLTEFLLPLF